MDHLLFPGPGGRYRYPFATMAVGDYFQVTIPEVAQSAWVSAQHHAKVHGRRFAKFREENGWWRIVRVA